MADSTLTSTALKSVTARNIHKGVYALYASYTSTTTPSASEVFLMLPLHSGVTVIDGWVKATFSSSFSMDLMVGEPGNKSVLMAATEVFSGNPIRFDNVPHVVTLTDSDSFPLMKPLTITIKGAASGTIVPTPVYSVMALLQNDGGKGV